MTSEPWTLACVCLVAPLIGAVWLAGRGRPTNRLIGMQLSSSLACLMLMAASFATDEASTVVVAVTLGLLSLPAGMLYALYLERWL